MRAVQGCRDILSDHEKPDYHRNRFRKRRTVREAFYPVFENLNLAGAAMRSELFSISASTPLLVRLIFRILCDLELFLQQG